MHHIYQASLSATHLLCQANNIWRKYSRHNTSAFIRNLIITLWLFGLVLGLISFPIVGNILFVTSAIPGQPDFRLPLPPDKDWLLSVEAGTSTSACPSGTGGRFYGGGYDCLHSGTSKYSLDFLDNNRQEGELTGRADVDILASAAGTVSNVVINPGQQLGCRCYGNYVVIDHGNGYTTLYGHLKDNSITVTRGQTLTSGAKIGVMGTTGDSTGIHIHFEIRYNGGGASQSAILDQVVVDGRRIIDYRVGSVSAPVYYRSTACGNGSSVSFRVSGGPPIHPNGTLIKVSGSSVAYVLQNGQKRGITSDAVLRNLYQQPNGGFDFKEIITVAQDEFDRYPTGSAVTSPLPPNGRSQPDGRLIRNSSGEISIVTNNGGRRPFPSMDIFSRLGYLLCNVVPVSDFDYRNSYVPEGPPVDGTSGQVFDFSISAIPPTRTVTVGGATTYTVNTVTTSGSPQTINLSISGLPSGATASFNPASITSGNSSTLTVTTSSSTPAGSYTLTITGSGSTTRSASVVLTANSPTPTPTPTPSPSPTPTPMPGSTSVQFSAASYSAGEGAGLGTVTVMRFGNTSGTSTIDYTVSDGTAEQRTDYTIASGTLRFAAGETSKTFTLLIADDAYPEGDETVNLALSNPTGASLGSRNAALLIILDNDTGQPTINPIDDARMFVRQHYLDFLNRAPDQGGWDYWTGQITQCGGSAACVNSRRIGVSAAYFIELEFQDTGSYVYRFYKASYGQRPAYAQFMPDRSRVIGGASLEAGKQAFADQWVQRSEFLARYPASLTGTQFIDALLQTVRQGSGVDLASQRTALINDYSANGSRARIVRLVADNPAFQQAEYNQAFVLMQYFGYLRRNADPGGYDFWLNVLNNREPGNFRGMVCAFLTSREYQERFSSVATRTNADCASVGP